MAISIDNAPSRIAAASLARNQNALTASLTRLSTGYRINTGKDDPAGLIASELLRSEKAATATAIANAQRADQVLATADGALSEVSNLLVSLNGLVVASANKAGLGSDEIAANQVEVDSILSTIDRISNSAAFAGSKLLNGSLDFTISGGPNAQILHGLTVHGAAISANGSQTVAVNVISSAQHAGLIFHNTSNGLDGPVDLWITGNTGAVQLSFASSIKASAIAAAVSAISHTTGVTASASGNDVAFLSTGLGSSQFVSVQANTANFQTATVAAPTITGVTRTSGTDAVVALNGQSVTAQGLDVNYESDGLSASFTLDPTKNQAGQAAYFTVTGGGARFSISPHIDTGGQALLGLPSVHTGGLGLTYHGTTGYTLSDLATNGRLALARDSGELAQQVVKTAITDVASLRGRIGAFRKFTLQSQMNSLNITLENLSSAESSIRDTDFASETAELTRQQLLVAATQSSLLTANQNQQIILKLLGA